MNEKKHWKYLQTSFCQYSPTINFRKGCACQANADGQLLLKCELTVKKINFLFSFKFNTLYKGHTQGLRYSTTAKWFHCNQLHAYISYKFRNFTINRTLFLKKMKNMYWIVEIAWNISVINKNTLSILLLVSDLHPLTTSKCMLLKSIYMLLSLIKKISFTELL